MMNPAEFAHIATAEQGFWWYRGMRRILFRLLDPIARSRSFTRVVEAGCGTGYLARQLADRYGWTMFPLDLGWEGLLYAHDSGLSRLVQGDIRHLPYADSACDMLVSMDVLVHLPRGEERDVLREFARVLEPGGIVVIRVSALEILRSRHSDYVGERQRFTRGQLVNAAESAGLRVERCTYLNSLLVPVALAKFRIWEPLTRQEPSSGVEGASPLVNSILELPLRAEAALVDAGVNLPIGQSILLIASKPAIPA